MAMIMSMIIDFNKPIETTAGTPVSYGAKFETESGTRHVVATSDGYFVVCDYGIMRNDCYTPSAANIRNVPEPPKKLYEEGQRFTKMLPKQKGNDMRTADAKGRVTLGDKFANRAVIIRVVDETEVIVTLARVIPEREAWLYDNAGAKAAVFEGIEEARNGKVVDGPDMAAADALVNAIENEEV